jgi:hypothetical protein
MKVYLLSADQTPPRLIYKVIGSVNVKVFGAPDNVTHSVKGSLPTCSVVLPCIFVTLPPGKVTGIGTEQTWLVASTMNPVTIVAFPLAA